ncbi:hypothetical protein KSP40_PGU000863 [Platanthera guangdongensis]|uniref:Uncharacterized protein n=1 Tax=Platanthera guangdongensis TaxID=2320717 RepID=A0ABR2LJH0_9ASPA
MIERSSGGRNRAAQPAREEEIALLDFQDDVLELLEIDCLFRFRHISKNYISTTNVRFAANVLELHEGTKKTLVMREIPKDSVKKLLSNKELLAACDIAILSTTGTFSTCPKYPYKDAAEMNILGGLSLEGYLSEKITYFIIDDKLIFHKLSGLSSSSRCAASSSFLGPLSSISLILDDVYLCLSLSPVIIASARGAMNYSSSIPHLIMEIAKFTRKTESDGNLKSFNYNKIVISSPLANCHEHEKYSTRGVCQRWERCRCRVML